MSPLGVAERPRRAFQLIAGALVGISLLVLSVSHAYAAGNGAWAVEPSGSPEEDVAPRGFFFYELAPGQSVTDWVAIKNQSDEPLSLNLYAADAFNLEDGSWALTEHGEPVRDVGAWIDFSEDVITVDPGTELRMQFTITAPQDISPGDYAGGIVAMNQQVEGVLEGTTSVALQRAVGARAFVRITGPVRPALAVLDVTNTVEDRLSADGGDVYTTYTVKNVGNMRLSPAIVVTADGLRSEEYFRSEPIEIPILLPGETATFTHVWTDVPWLDMATVTVVANHDKIVAAGSSDVLLVSPVVWLLVIAAGLMAALIVARRRRRKRDRGTVIEVDLVGADR